MKEVKKEIEVLEIMYQNILMIKEAILTIIKLEGIDNNLNYDLKNILVMYKRLIQALIGMLKNRKRNVKELGIGEKMATYMSIKINLNKSNDTSDIARMLIQDVKLRTDSLKKIIEEYDNLSKTIINIEDRIYLTNKKCVEILEKYAK